ncbi:Signal peptide peptidase [Entamoeba marina]
MLSSLSITWKQVIIFPLLGSLMLVIVFFFPSVGKYMMYFSVLTSCCTCFYALCSPLIPKAVYMNISWDKVLSCVISMSVLVFYYFTQTWWSSNVIAFGIAIAMQSFIFVNRLYIPVALLTLMFFYDIFWVFGSKHVSAFGDKSVMVEVAKVASTLKLPMLLEFRAFFSDGHFVIGLGDIVLPGILLNFAYSVDHFLKSRYFIVTLIGYLIGLLITVFVLHIFQVGQPALLYLVPSMLIPFILSMVHKKQFMKIATLDLSTSYPMSVEIDDDTQFNEEEMISVDIN